MANKPSTSQSLHAQGDIVQTLASLTETADQLEQFVTEDPAGEMTPITLVIGNNDELSKLFNSARQNMKKAMNELAQIVMILTKTN